MQAPGAAEWLLQKPQHTICNEESRAGLAAHRDSLLARLHGDEATALADVGAALTKQIDFLHLQYYTRQ